METEDIGRVARRVIEQLDLDQEPERKDVAVLARRCDGEDKRIREVIDLLAQTRNTFRSKQIERARKILEELL